MNAVEQAFCDDFRDVLRKHHAELSIEYTFVQPSMSGVSMQVELIHPNGPLDLGVYCDGNTPVKKV